MDNYRQACFEHIETALNDLVGYEVDVSELWVQLTESENANGSWYCSRYQAEQDLDSFGRDTVAQFIEEYEIEYGQKPEYDAYAQPELFHCLMMIMGINNMLNQSSFIGDHWDENIILTQKHVDTIINELS